tara:strand:+ start:1917 stop:3107 length:1191 start_codon:yes stop_codon:yes gene_type:complete
MAIRVQFRRGTTNEHSTFTGVAGEVTVNTENKSLVVHDGSTAGGSEVIFKNLTDTPTDYGTANQVLTTSGSALSWSSLGSTYQTISPTNTDPSYTWDEASNPADITSASPTQAMLLVGGTNVTIGSNVANHAIKISAATELSSDATPQLGGNLDVNSNSITSATNGNVVLDPHGTGVVNFSGNSTQPGEVRFFEDTDDGSNYIGLKAGTVGTSLTYTLPITDGTAGDALITNGSGTLSFTTISGGGSSTLEALSDTTITNPANTEILTYNGSAWVNSASAGGAPGGIDTQVQFNDGGSTFGGDAGFTYNKTTDVVTAGSFATTAAGTPTLSSNTGVEISATSGSITATTITGGMVLPRLTTTQRDAISTNVDGMVVYNTSTNKFQGRANSTWVDLH